jgi:hypothetical protein
MENLPCGSEQISESKKLQNLEEEKNLSNFGRERVYLVSLKTESKEKSCFFA